MRDDFSFQLAVARSNVHVEAQAAASSAANGNHAAALVHISAAENAIAQMRALITSEKVAQSPAPADWSAP